MTTEKATQMAAKGYHWFQIGLGVVVMAVFAFQGIRGLIGGHTLYGAMMLAIAAVGGYLFKVARKEYINYKKGQSND